jgi:hypothetical protein
LAEEHFRRHSSLRSHLPHFEQHVTPVHLRHHRHLLIEDAEEVDCAWGPHAPLGAGLGLILEVTLRGRGREERRQAAR